MAVPVLPPAVEAFDRVALDFDQRFGGWLSVAAQRRAVRRHLDRAFRRGDAVLELGGGTGEDALYLARRGVRVLLTDGSPEMVSQAACKARQAGLNGGLETRQLVLEALPQFADVRQAADQRPFDGAYSNFAALNCIDDLEGLARSLARLLQPGAPALLVLFGPIALGEVFLQLLRGDLRAAFRRVRRGPVPAHIAGRDFLVHYHRPHAVVRAFHPYFQFDGARGVGIFVPPSAAEPGISRWPRVLKVLELLDRLAEAPLAQFGDHVLLRFRRASSPTP